MLSPAPPIVSSWPDPGTGQETWDNGMRVARCHDMDTGQHWDNTRHTTGRKAHYIYIYFRHVTYIGLQIRSGNDLI